MELPHNNYEDDAQDAGSARRRRRQGPIMSEYMSGAELDMDSST